MTLRRPRLYRSAALCGAVLLLVGLAMSPTPALAADKTRALVFDGVDDIAVVPDAPALNPTTAMTLEFWVRYDSIDRGQWGVLKDDGTANRQYALGLSTHTSDGTARFRPHIGTQAGYAYFDGATAVQPNIWYHVAQTYDGATLRLYVNGQPDGELTVNSPMISTTTPVTFGNNPEAVYALDGTLDEIRIWSVARTQTQVANALGRTVKPRRPGMVGYWRLDDGRGQFARDRSGLGQRAQRGSTSLVEADDPLWTRSVAPLS